MNRLGSLLLRAGFVCALWLGVAPARAWAAPDFSRSVKSVDDKTPAPGDTLDFTISVVNSGSAVNGVTVIDNLPSNVTYVQGSTTATGTTSLFPVPVTLPVPDNGTQSGLSGTGFPIPVALGSGGLLSLSRVDFHLKATVNAGTFGQQICNTGIVGAPTLVPFTL
ncbi:MAG: DUF11 domain-containing protein, partial [Deltaproteobacteria bacterium]|nr:DUF11 domain-containing protein [Deltaproteobacteria bacterium]